MTIQEYHIYDESEILPLYESVGWTAYTQSPASLRAGFAASLLTLAAYEGDQLLGIVRTVGDGHTILLVQDILVYPAYQRRGIGTALLQAVLARFSHVRQIQLVTDCTEKTLAFYRAQGFVPLAALGCCGFMKA